MARVAEDYYNIEKLVGVENFQMWKFQIKILFRANEVLEIVTEDRIDNRDDIYKKKCNCTEDNYFNN